ncbi:MAG: hypothetical protein H7Y00_05845 [Fimbriimonadaceae bacterium]|nr:hypothetical protein [Chitinophagales bacterium]
MKKNIFKPALLIFLFFCPLLSNAQDTALLKKYVREQFELTADINLSYHSNDFYIKRFEKTTKEEPSFEKVEELLDSLKNNYDLNIVFRIAGLYEKLNRKTLSIQYYNEAKKGYEEKLIQNPADTNAIDALMMLSLETNDLLKAILYNQKKLEIAPNDTLASIAMSSLFLFAGDYTQANIHADKAIGLYPEIPDSYLYKVMALVFPEIFLIQSSANLNAAIGESANFKSDFSFLDKAANNYKENIEVQFSVLCCKYFTFFYKLLIPYFLNAEPQPPHKIRFKFSDEDLSQLKKYEKEFSVFLKSKEFKNYYPVYLSHGTINMLQNNFDESIRDFKKSIQYKDAKYRDAQDNVADAYSNIIACYLFMNDSTNAEIWANKKIEDKAAVYNVATDYVMAGIFKAVKNDLESGKQFMYKAIEVDSACYQAMIQIGNIYLLEDDYKKADQYFNAAYKLNKDDPAVYYSYILYSLFVKDKSTANSLLNRLLEYNPDNAFAIEIKGIFLKE